MNRELPYHDYMRATSSTVPTFYVVGANQQAAHGAQHKLFASKSTLIFSSGDNSVTFNNTNNVSVFIADHVWYEFKSNIEAVHWTTPTGYDFILFYFEGVLPEEARDPE